VPSKTKAGQAGGEFRSGSVFGDRFTIQKLIASGPHSTVYLANDQLTNKPAALKIAGVPSERIKAAAPQYRLELNLLRQTQHRSLVHIFDAGEYLGRVFVAMELIDGVTLRDHLRSAAETPFHQFAQFFTSICGALAQLHAQRIIHRDIHPANIMITPAGEWKLMDFGIGRDLKKRGSPEARYAAPEQLAGLSPSFAVDIYALGAVSYEMLTGKQPHSHGGPRQNAVFLAEEIAGCPEGLAHLIETCLHVDPVKRFQNIEALRAASAQVFNSAHTLADARPLEELQRDSAADAGQMAALFARIVRALMEQHESGQVHAELSPKKIRLRGESIAIENACEAPAPSSQSTLLIADARYAAPELIMARSAPDQTTHVRGDIYVLGFLFYELLAGKQEMQRQLAELEQAQTGLAWMRWHSNPKLKLRSLDEVAPNCPKPLAELIERMLEKDPAHRPETLEEILAVLDRVNSRLDTTQSVAIKTLARSSQPRRPAGLLFRTLTVALILSGLVAAGKWAGLRPWQYFADLKLHAPIASRAPNRPIVRPPIIHTSSGDMMLVPEGGFVMGDSSMPNAAPEHEVLLPAFYIDRLEVSNRHFREFCVHTGATFPIGPSWDPDYGAKDDHPVVNARRDQAAAFCNFAGKRLPTEEEWEKAARGPGASPVLWGNWTLAGLANLRGSGLDRPAAVASFAADVSPFGVQDLAGNVQEWVAGEFKLYSARTEAASAQEPGQGIVRGGSFRTAPEQLSPAWREPLPLNAGNQRLESVGFRCATDAPILSLEK
jgi:serine/threonine protein kinase